MAGLSLLRYSIITLIVLTRFVTSPQHNTPRETWPTGKNEELPDEDTNPKYSWSNSKQTFIQDIISMAKDFPHQKRETWIQLISAIGHTLEDEPPQHPAVITVLLLPNVSSEFSTCFLKKVATVLNKAVHPILQGQNEVSTGQYTGPHILSPNTFDSNSITSIRNDIEVYLSTNGKSLLVLDIDKFQHEKDLMVFHGLCDNYNAVDPRATLLFPVPVPKETFDKYPSWNHTDGGDISNEVLSNAWKTIVRPNIGPALVARIADAVILLNDGDTCNDDVGLSGDTTDKIEHVGIKITDVVTSVEKSSQTFDILTGQPVAVEDKNICLPGERGSHSKKQEEDGGDLNIQGDLEGNSEYPTPHEIVESGDDNQQEETGFSEDAAYTEKQDKLPGVPIDNVILGEDTVSEQQKEKKYCSQKQGVSQMLQRKENKPDVYLQPDREQNSGQPETQELNQDCDEEGDGNGAITKPVKSDQQKHVHSVTSDNGRDNANDHNGNKRSNSEYMDDHDHFSGKKDTVKSENGKRERKKHVEHQKHEQQNKTKSDKHGETRKGGHPSSKGSDKHFNRMEREEENKSGTRDFQNKEKSRFDDDHNSRIPRDFSKRRGFQIVQKMNGLQKSLEHLEHREKEKTRELRQIQNQIKATKELLQLLEVELNEMKD